jgi:pyruvate formate lyase activating enzyme
MKTVMKKGLQYCTAMADQVLINFGGFVPLSTVDWRGRSVCVIFFRGCPVKCWYCHNPSIQTGRDLIPADDVIRMVQDASLLISGVIFSGGEATMQPEALEYLAREVKKMGLHTGLHTNGVFPEVISSLIASRLIDYIALDSKPEWNLNTVTGKDRTFGFEVKKTLEICVNSHRNGELPRFEVVLTLFPGCREQVSDLIDDLADDPDLVLQQGTYIGIRPLTISDLKAIADQLGRTVRIRTRDEGETEYEGNRGSRDARIR